MRHRQGAIVAARVMLLSLVIASCQTPPAPPTQASPTQRITGQATVGNISVSGAYVQATVLADPIVTALATEVATMSGMDMGNVTSAATTADSGPVSGAYMVIQNNGDQPDKLISVVCDLAQTTTLHETIIKGDMASMQMLTSLDIPAGGSVALKPGGYHAMLMGLKHPLVAGRTATLTLTFASGTIVTLQAPILAP